MEFLFCRFQLNTIWLVNNKVKIIAINMVNGQTTCELKTQSNCFYIFHLEYFARTLTFQFPTFFQNSNFEIFSKPY